MKPLDEGQAAYYGLAQLMFLLSKKGVISMQEVNQIVKDAFKGFEGLMEKAIEEGKKK